ncbi:MAG: oxygenase MpaB family protein, partial [Acidimicrobiales bacterium]
MARRAPRPIDLGELGPPPPRVAPGAMFEPGSAAARLLGHPAVLLGGTRALLLQLAHPSVAAGVADHSDFQAAPFDRLLRTLSAMGTIGFADPATSQRALAAVATTHQRVRGRRQDGRPYAAGDPRLAAWVHATLIDTALAVEARWLGAFSLAERQSFYRQTLALARAFGAPVEGDGAGEGDGQDGGDAPGGSLPGDLAGFGRWFRAGMDALEVTEAARSMGADVLHPPLTSMWGRWAAPVERAVAAGLAAVTAELLPRRLRLAYGLPEPAGARGAALD